MQNDIGVFYAVQDRDKDVPFAYSMEYMLVSCSDRLGIYLLEIYKLIPVGRHVSKSKSTICWLVPRFSYTSRMESYFRVYTSSSISCLSLCWLVRLHQVHHPWWPLLPCQPCYTFLFLALLPFSSALQVLGQPFYCPLTSSQQPCIPSYYSCDTGH